MDRKLTNEEQFDAYYFGRLTKEEELVFELRLKEDSAFSAAFAQHLRHQEMIRDNSRTAFQEMMAELPMGEAPRVRKLQRVRPLAVAASVCGLVLASYLLYPQFNHWPKVEQVAVQALQQERVQITTMGELTSVKTASEVYLEQGKTLLDQEQYQEAIAQLAKVERKSDQEYDNYIVAQFSIALASIRLRDQEKAVEALKAIIAEQGAHYLKAPAKTILNELK